MTTININSLCHQHILITTLQHFSPADLLRARLVCRYWKALLDDDEHQEHPWYVVAKRYKYQPSRMPSLAIVRRATTTIERSLNFLIDVMEARGRMPRMVNAALVSQDSLLANLASDGLEHFSDIEASLPFTTEHQRGFFKHAQEAVLLYDADGIQLPPQKLKRYDYSTTSNKFTVKPIEGVPFINWSVFTFAFRSAMMVCCPNYTTNMRSLSICRNMLARRYNVEIAQQISKVTAEGLEPSHVRYRTKSYKESRKEEPPAIMATRVQHKWPSIELAALYEVLRPLHNCFRRASTDRINLEFGYCGADVFGDGTVDVYRVVSVQAARRIHEQIDYLVFNALRLPVTTIDWPTTAMEIVGVECHFLWFEDSMPAFADLLATVDGIEVEYVDENSVDLQIDGVSGHLYDMSDYADFTFYDVPDESRVDATIDRLARAFQCAAGDVKQVRSLEAIIQRHRHWQVIAHSSHKLAT